MVIPGSYALGAEREEIDEGMIHPLTRVLPHEEGLRSYICVSTPIVLSFSKR